MGQPSMHMSKRVVGWAFCGLLLSWGTAHAAPTYTVTDLGTLGGAASQARGINNQGDVVGSAYTADGETHAFLHSHGQMRDLGSLDGFIGTAESVSSQGVVVGGYVDKVETHLPDGRWLTFLYSSGQARSFLGNTHGQILGINSQGEMVGWLATSQGQRHAFLYSGSHTNDLGTLGGTYSVAYGINDQGDAAGWADTRSEERHAFLYSSGVMVDLGTLGGAHSAAKAINALGEVAGWADTSGEETHAFLYSSRRMIDLGTLGGNSSEASGINRTGLVVGFSTTSTGATRAFLYTGGRMVDLNSLIPSGTGWTLVSAAAINDAGKIAATGTNARGVEHALLLSPAHAP